MTQKVFKTKEVLAVMHSFISILAAKKSGHIKEGAITKNLDKLQDLTPQMAGIEYARDHLSWCDLSQALRPVLKGHFNALAAEVYPDRAYWAEPKAFDPEKVTRLAEWVKAMERKYGETLELPDFSAEVLQALRSQSQKTLTR